MEYKKGDRVKHPTLNEWGVGEVLADSNGDSVRVFFVGVGEKTLALAHVQPIPVSGVEAAHPMLDNLKTDKSATGVKYQSLPQSIQFFLEQFPEGFYGERFTRNEREYKAKASVLAKEMLGKTALGSLLNKHDYNEAAKRALKIVNTTNLIFPNEKMSLKDGLVNPSNQRNFCDVLHEMLYGKKNMEKRFNSFAGVLEELGAAKWTIATYFLFLIRPEEHMFIKPTITKHSAELCGFEINYRPQLNWLTYKSVLDFSQYLFDALSELKPRDMIDVQSFMWCIAPGTIRVL